MSKLKNPHSLMLSTVLNSPNQFNYIKNPLFDLLMKIYKKNYHDNHRIKISFTGDNDSINHPEPELPSALKYIVNNVDKFSMSNITIKNSNKFVIISIDDINENLRHIDTELNITLHQVRCAVFSNNTFEPICVIDKCIKAPEYKSIDKNVSYLTTQLHNMIPEYKTDEFNKKNVVIKKRYIGSFMVLFCLDKQWYFLLKHNIYELQENTHPVLYEHLKNHINNFDPNMCYHIVLIDNRIRQLISPNGDKNRVVIVKTTDRKTLKEIPLPSDDFMHNVMSIDKRIYLSCLDELYVRLEELDVINLKMKKMINRGYIVTVTSRNNKISIGYDTNTYRKLMSYVPSDMSIHEIHLHLYQQDKLSFFLQYATESHVDVVKRINLAVSTLSRELLDIYHMTRKKQNGELYNLLPQSYRQFIYQMHSKYINKKNNDSKENEYSDMKLHFTSSEDSTSSDESDTKDYTDFKISITVDNVYTKLKEIDTKSLVELFIDRDALIKDLEINNHVLNPIKNCTITKVESKFLGSK